MSLRYADVAMLIITAYRDFPGEKKLLSHPVVVSQSAQYLRMVDLLKTESRNVAKTLAIYFLYLTCYVTQNIRFNSRSNTKAAHTHVPTVFGGLTELLLPSLHKVGVL